MNSYKIIIFLFLFNSVIPNIKRQLSKQQTQFIILSIRSIFNSFSYSSSLEKLSVSKYLFIAFFSPNFSIFP